MSRDIKETKEIFKCTIHGIFEKEETVIENGVTELCPKCGCALEIIEVVK